MMPRHHLDPATIVSYAAGAMSPELSAIVATHLGGCAMCRKAITSADTDQLEELLEAERQGHQREDVIEACLDGLRALS